MSKTRTHRKYKVVNTSPSLTEDEKEIREREISKKVYELYQRHLERINQNVGQ